MVKNEILKDAIHAYGIERFSADIGMSLSMIKSVCNGHRKLGVFGENAPAKKAVVLLGLELEAIRPDVFKVGRNTSGDAILPT